MNVVSFETAKRLKDAGFPQPEKQPGQIWYGTRYKGGTMEYSCPFFIGKMSETYRCSDGNHLAFGSHVFAPSATDILKELGRTWNLYYDKYPTPTPCNWVCICDGVNMPQNPQYNTNPAEACAAAWLSIHEKTANQ